jgi:peptidyl-prolyl cis-trans isomerase D
VINAAFTSDIGVDTEALQVPGGGFLWYDVTGITQSRERTLEEVKDQVAARWRDDEIAKRLQAKSDDLLGKLKAGTALAQAATEAGLTVSTAADLQRGRPAGFIPAKVVEDVFKTAKGAAASAEGETPTQRLVFRVTDVIEPKFDAKTPEAQRLTTTLQNSFADDIIGEYIGRLESDYGVSINQAALNQVIGGAPANQ